MRSYKKQSFLLWVASIPIALAQDQDTDLYQESYGGGYSPLGADEYTRGLISNGNQHPNATRSIKSKPFEYAAEESDFGNLRKVEWTWREYLPLLSALIFSEWAILLLRKV